MPIIHSPDQITVTFDHDHAVANAGLILAASLGSGTHARWSSFDECC